MAYLMWSLARLTDSICNRLQNRFDVFIAIEGKRGLGKSTLGFILMRRVKREMKKRGVEGYKFYPKHDLLYTRDEVLKFFHKWKHSGVADEMINVSFNRDFYNQDQKDLIKMINMNRDHNNLFIACVPQFKVLDPQIKNLVCMKLTVVRRGLAIVQTPNKTIYASDIWDEFVNEKIERKWLEGGVTRPRYSKLTTFRGLCKFPKLSEKEEEKYQKIKTEKRNIIAKDKGLEEKEDEKSKDPFEIIYRKFVNREVKNKAMLDGMLAVFDLPESTIEKIRRRLQKEKRKSSFRFYYYDAPQSKKEEEIDQLFSEA